MGLINGLCNIIGDVVSTVAGSPLIPALKYTAKAAVPILLNNLNNTYNSSANYQNNISSCLDVNRQVAVANNVMGEDIDLVSFEIMSCVNTISQAINEMISELGEENVFIDEILIGYFIQKFKVPARYADRVYRILENNYMIENKCLRDGIRLNNGNVKKKELETGGGKQILKQRKNGEIDSSIINDLFFELITRDLDEKEIKKLIG